MQSDLTTKVLSLALSPAGELEAWLDSLSNANFRIAGDAVAQALPRLQRDDQWRLVIRLTRYNNRAFLGTLLKQMPRMLADSVPAYTDESPVMLAAPAMRTWSHGMTAIDRHKTLMALLPIASMPQDVSLLLEIFGQNGAAIGHGHDIDYLIQSATPASLFVLLGYMRLGEHDRMLLTRICRRLMQRGTQAAFNAASVFKVFFDLADVHGTFSLRIEPYELGRMETDFGLFKSRIS